MIRLIRLGENPAHGNITLPRRNAPSVLRSRSGIPMTMCRQNPKWSPMAREGKDYRWCNLDLMRFQGLEQVPRKTVATQIQHMVQKFCGGHFGSFQTSCNQGGPSLGLSFWQLVCRNGGLFSLPPRETITSWPMGKKSQLASNSSRKSELQQ